MISQKKYKNFPIIFSKNRKFQKRRDPHNPRIISKSPIRDQPAKTQRKHRLISHLTTKIPRLEQTNPLNRKFPKKFRHRLLTLHKTPRRVKSDVLRPRAENRAPALQAAAPGLFASAPG